MPKPFHDVARLPRYVRVPFPYEERIDVGDWIIAEDEDVAADTIHTDDFVYLTMPAAKKFFDLCMMVIFVMDEVDGEVRETYRAIAKAFVRLNRSKFPKIADPRPGR